MKTLDQNWLGWYLDGSSQHFHNLSCTAYEKETQLGSNKKCKFHWSFPLVILCHIWFGFNRFSSIFTTFTVVNIHKGCCYLWYKYQTHGIWKDEDPKGSKCQSYCNTLSVIELWNIDINTDKKIKNCCSILVHVYYMVTVVKL